MNVGAHSVEEWEFGFLGGQQEAMMFEGDDVVRFRVVSFSKVRTSCC